MIIRYNYIVATKNGKEYKIAAVIPAFNEESSIGGVTAAVRRHLPVMVVDDGSKDGTAAAAEAAGAVVLRQQPNQGKGAALRLGLKRALENGCDAVVTLDADGQHDPAEIPAFLGAFYREQSDLIIGERNFEHMPLIRRMANSLGGRLLSWAAGTRITDNQSGYRLISRRLAEIVLESRVQGFEFEIDMIMLCLRHGFKMSGVAIHTIYAGEKSHIQPLGHAWRFLEFCWRVYRQRKTKTAAKA